MNTIISVLALGSLALANPYKRDDPYALPLTKRDLTVQTNAGWQSLGCYSDVQSARTLRAVALQGDNVSGTVCQAECQRQGFVYAGTEYAGECWCDNAINMNAKSKPDSDCNMACKADATQPCGGPDRINVFWNGTTVAGATNGSPPNKTLAAGWTSTGCYTDSVQLRTLSGYLVGPDTGMTIEHCVNGCAAKGWSYAGLEFGQECYCGNTIDNNATVAATADCNLPCQGDSAQTCGGQSRLQLYSGPKPAVVSSAAPSSSSAAPTSSSAAPAASSAAPAPEDLLPRYDLPDNYKRAGCYYQNSMAYTWWSYTSMTPNACIAACKAKNYDLAATDYADYCRCGASSAYLSKLNKIDQSKCNSLCSGNKSMLCGGYYALDVYIPK